MPASAPTPEQDRVTRKLSAARTQLIIEKPFLGVLVLHLPLTEADPQWCKTVATDMRAIYYSRAYVEQLNLEQTKFILAHEALHCGLSHFHRREHRTKHRWDVACDFAVNAILVADGLTPPTDALIQDRYAGMSAEEIYPYIKDHPDGEPLDQHLYDQGDDTSDRARGEGTRRNRPAPPSPEGEQSPLPDDGAPERRTDHHDKHAGEYAGVDAARSPAPLSGSARELAAAQWQLRLAGAAQQALRAGKLPASIARLIDNLLQPQLPWRMLLARHMTAVARTDYSFSRPNRREGAAILPGLRAACVDVVVAIDTSGSIEPEEMREFVSEIDAIKGQLNARITLHACDAALAVDGPWIFEPWDALRLPSHFTGGGGTRFTPVFEWAEQLERAPELLIYFTDAEGEFPGREPNFPVLWLVKGNAAVPWGQRVQLN
jgi:predicted metal-dependent peptidase